MSQERHDLYMQVLRPYFSSLTSPSHCTLQGFSNLMDRFLGDLQLSQFLTSEFSQVKAVSALLDQPNQQIFDLSTKVRFFFDAMAESFALSMLKHLSTSELLSYCNDIKSKINFSSENERDFFITSNLMQICTVALALKAQALIPEAGYKIPSQGDGHSTPKTGAGVFVDMEPNDITFSLLSNVSPHYNQLYSFAYNPNQLQSLVHNQSLRTLTARHTIFKSLLAINSNVRVVFDAQGRMTVNQRSNPNACFVTRSISSTINETKANVIKFALNSDIVNFLHAADARKSILRHKVSLLASTIHTGLGMAHTNGFNLQNTFADLALVAEFIQYVQNFKHPYQIQLQYEARYMGRLQILVCPLESTPTTTD